MPIALKHQQVGITKHRIGTLVNILYWEQKELNNARACVHGEAIKSVGFADCGCIPLPRSSSTEIYLVVYKVVYAGATQYWLYFSM